MNNRAAWLWLAVALFVLAISLDALEMLNGVTMRMALRMVGSLLLLFSVLIEASNASQARSSGGLSAVFAVSAAAFMLFTFFA
jgi:hypothetical protein